MRKTSATEGRRYRALARNEEHYDAYVRRFVWAGVGTDGLALDSPRPPQV